MSDDAFYKAFIDEIDALTVKADDSAAGVLGVCTRAAKRAQMVVDGELPPVESRTEPTKDGERGTP